VEVLLSSDFDQLIGTENLRKLMKIFYDKIYADPWIGEYFKDIPQEIIESQQVDFLEQSLGGVSRYCGKLPVRAHKHMFITEELYELRSKLLQESLDEIDASQELKDRLQKIDDSFRGSMIKESASECEKRFATDKILDIPNPNKPFKNAA
jgi:hemoglobin